MPVTIDANEVIDNLGHQLAAQAIEIAKLNARIAQLTREQEAGRAAGAND